MRHLSEITRSIGRRHSTRYLTWIVFGLFVLGGLLLSGCEKADDNSDADSGSSQSTGETPDLEQPDDSGVTDEENPDELTFPGLNETAEQTIFAPLTRDGKTVAQVDLSRYLGTWYEIATYVQPFQRGCVGTTATYTARDDGTIGVRNDCRVGSLDGRLKSITGFARVADETTNARLLVYFFQPFIGAPYWVIELDGQEGEQPYEFAIVGSSSSRFLWVLSRMPQISPERWEAILARLAQRGYEIDKLSFTPQA